MKCAHYVFVLICSFAACLFAQDDVEIKTVPAENFKNGELGFTLANDAGETIQAATDTVVLDVVIELGTQLYFSRSVGSCFAASYLTCTPNLPTFIKHEQLNSTISQYGSVDFDLGEHNVAIDSNGVLKLNSDGLVFEKDLRVNGVMDWTGGALTGARKLTIGESLHIGGTSSYRKKKLIHKEIANNGKVAIYGAIFCRVSMIS